MRVNSPSSEFRKSHRESYGIFKEYQMRIHREEESDCSVGQFDDFLCEGPLEVVTLLKRGTKFKLY